MSNEIIRRDDHTIVPARETSTSATKERARAELESAFTMARQFPRDQDRVRQLVLKECKRSSFADVALYSLPRGGKRIEGLSIRAAEAMRRAMGNLGTYVSTVFDGDDHQLVRVTCIDFEANVFETDEIVVPKYVERRNPKDMSQVVGQRVNSEGQITFKVLAGPDDFRMKRNGEIARAKRNVILSMVPGDIKDEAIRLLHETRRSDAKQDPDAYRKRVADSFAEIGVTADALRDYLGHELGSASPAELEDLRAVYTMIKDGEASWHECLAAKTGVDSDANEDPHAELKKKIADRADKQRKGKPKATRKDKAKSEPIPDEVSRMMLAAGVDEAKARKMVDEGWEIDDDGEAIPPAGGEG